MFTIKPNPEKKVDGKVLQVFDPVKKDFLPAEGRCVPETEYWVRRLSDGSVVKTDSIPEVAPKKAAKGKVKTNDKED